jgi:3D (Asp-Asp-Asp) domain-containing protein
MRKRLLTAIVSITAIISIAIPTVSRARDYYIDQSELFEVEENGFHRMSTTAYMVQGITATGTPTHSGICACNPRLGQMAIVYTTDGEYLGSFECVDTGSTEGLQKGTVIDVWFDTYEECENWMIRTRGKVYVKWIQGEG